MADFEAHCASGGGSECLVTILASNVAFKKRVATIGLLIRPALVTSDSIWNQGGNNILKSIVQQFHILFTFFGEKWAFRSWISHLSLWSRIIIQSRLTKSLALASSSYLQSSISYTRHLTGFERCLQLQLDGYVYCVCFLSCLTKQRILHITHMHRSIFPPISTWAKLQRRQECKPYLDAGSTVCYYTHTLYQTTISTRKTLKKAANMLRQIQVQKDSWTMKISSKFNKAK